jgi:hypothetical protein
MCNKLIKALAQPKAINMEANPTKPIPTFRQKKWNKRKMRESVFSRSLESSESSRPHQNQTPTSTICQKTETHQ